MVFKKYLSEYIDEQLEWTDWKLIETCFENKNKEGKRTGKKPANCSHHVIYGVTSLNCSWLAHFLLLV